MAAPANKPWLWIVAAVVVVLGAVGGGVYFWLWRANAELPAAQSDRYREYVELFQVGVGALDVIELPEMAEDKLSEAIKKIPAEPAAWANRGLLRLRNNDFVGAASDLKKASELAPGNLHLEALLGHLEEQKGNFSEAANHFRKALEKDPKDLPTRYALIKVLEKQGDQESAEYYKQLVAIAETLPNNLFILPKVAMEAARQKDADGLRKTLNNLEKISESWKPTTQQNLLEVERLAGGPLPGQIPRAINELGDQLKTELGYNRDSEAVDPRGQNLGQPIRQFLRLAPMRSSPAAPDLGLAYSKTDAPLERKIADRRWSALLPVWLTDGPHPTLFVANDAEVARIDGKGAAMLFPGKGQAPSAVGVIPIDWKNEFRTSFVLAGRGGLRFYQNDNQGAFKDVTAQTGLDKKMLEDDYYGGWAVDWDMDGDLDLIVARVAGPPLALRNNRDGTFTVVDLFKEMNAVRVMVWTDFDNDGAPDAAFLDQEGRLHVYANERSGQFRRRETPQGLGKCLALAVADVNDDGKMDLVALKADGSVIRISDEPKANTWRTADLVKCDRPLDLKPGEAKLIIADLDNNGALDILVSTAKETYTWLGEEPGVWKKLESSLPGGFVDAVQLGQAGLLDLLRLSDAGQPEIWNAKSAKNYHWVSLRPHLTQGEVKADNRINSFGIGGELETRTGLQIQKQAITRPVVHFGLGERQVADVVRVVWPNSDVQFEFDKESDQVVEIEQRIKGSCPYLFTYDGREMAFVADFMWSTPLGMYINGQDKGGFLQTTDWVKIRGDHMKPRDGHYDIRVTANLWETHFLDHLGLLAVNHPADTEMFVDERFFLTPTKPQIYLTRQPRPVAMARDQADRDVTELIRSVDGKYLDTFDLGPFQGIASDHWVEIDLGDDVPAQGPVYLLAYGFVRPTDSSINYAIEQGRHDKPKGLSLEIPDGQGGWKVANPLLGFPAGKNKTVVIRLDGITGPRAERRIRLRTNMEIYWDWIGYAAGLDVDQAQIRSVEPTRAELRHHGINEIASQKRSSPELPAYDRFLTRRQYWRDLIGYYTRYGDVRELLAKVDDRYVIMNAGDELALEFPVLADPPPGWKRDFVWVSDGWVKDGDLNTRFSKTVLPLPSHDMTSYDRPPGRLEDDPVYKRFPGDWRTYHTRYVTPEEFERGLRAFLPPKR